MASVHPSLAAGVWAVMPTPFRDGDLAVDLPAVERLVEFYRDSAVTGLLALGVFGEAARLSAREQGQVARRVLDVAGDIPVVLGLSALATAPAVEQGEQLLAASGGRAHALMLQVNTPEPDELAGHLDAVATACGVGIVVQDYPAASGVRVVPDVLAGVVERCQTAVAVKAESPPTSVAVARLSAQVDVPVFGGLGGVGLLDELAAGAAGAMTGFSYPEGLWSAVATYRDQGFDAARRAYAPWLPLANFEAQQGVGMAIRKEILHRRGVLSSAAVRPPGTALPDVLLPLLDHHLAALEQSANTSAGSATNG